MGSEWGSAIGFLACEMDTPSHFWGGEGRVLASAPLPSLFTWRVTLGHLSSPSLISKAFFPLSLLIPSAV